MNDEELQGLVPEGRKNPLVLDRLMRILWSWGRRRAEMELDRRPFLRLNASDAAQELCLRVSRRLAQFRGETAAEFRAWCGKILRNYLLDAGRRHEPEIGQESREAGLEAQTARAGSPSQHIQGEEQASRLKEALAALPDRHRMVFELRLLQGLSFAEVGHRLGISEGAARVLFFRVTRRLSQELGGHDEHC